MKERKMFRYNYLDLEDNSAIMGWTIPRTQQQAREFEWDVREICGLIASSPSSTSEDWEIWEYSDGSKFKFYYSDCWDVYKILGKLPDSTEWKTIFQILKPLGSVTGNELNKVISL